MITPSFYPALHYGGPIYSTYDLAKTLKRENVDIKVVTTNANGNEKLKIKTGVFHTLEDNLPVKYYPSLDSRGTSLSMHFNLRKDFKQSEIIYLISIFSPTTPLTIMLCKFFKKPLIISPQGQLGKWCLAQGNRFKKLWLKTFIKPNTQSIFWQLTSAEEEKDLLAIYPVGKTFVIPNGVGPELFTKSEVKKDKSFFNKYSGNDCKTKNIIISMGRIQKVKGFDILIESFDILVRQKPYCLLFIAGEDFGEKNTLQKLITK